MTQPLALVYYRKAMPGSQLVNRLRDLEYRIQTVNEPAGLEACAQTEGPMLIFADLADREQADTLKVITKLRANAATRHIPIVAFGAEDDALQQAAQTAGATMAVGETALLAHLPGLLEQALRVE